MSRNRITTTTKKVLAPKNITSDKILNFLKLYKDNKHTQKEIATGIGMSVPTVSREIKKMVGKTYSENQQHYTICQDENDKSENIYYAIHKDKQGNVVNKFKDPNRITYYVEKIAKKYIWTEEKAKVVNPYVVLCRINTRYFSKVHPILIQMCGEAIIDVVPCKEGIYVILDNVSNIREIRNDIRNLHKEAYRISHNASN